MEQKSTLFHIIKLIRVEQWTKNLIIFLPLFFNQQFDSLADLKTCFLIFIWFSITASAVYCFNDIKDLAFDQLHPTKKNRPLASGAISKNTAILTMLVLLILSAGIAVFQPLEVTGILLGYVLMNIAYTLFLKNIVIIDLIIVALGFVLRIFIAGTALDIYLSQWIIIMTFLLALFLIIAKRRDDLLIYTSQQIKARHNINMYNLDFINAGLYITSSVIIVAYIMYTLSPEVMERFGSTHIYGTALFVIIGILRYLQLTLVAKKSGNPTKLLLSDTFLQCTIVGWLLSFIFVIYL